MVFSKTVNSCDSDPGYSLNESIRIQVQQSNESLYFSEIFFSQQISFLGLDNRIRIKLVCVRPIADSFRWGARLTLASVARISNVTSFSIYVAFYYFRKAGMGNSNYDFGHNSAEYRSRSRFALRLFSPPLFGPQIRVTKYLAL